MSTLYLMILNKLSYLWKRIQVLTITSYYAVVTPTQIQWIESLVNAEGTMVDVTDSFPDLTTDEICEVVYDGMVHNRIAPQVAKTFLSEGLENVPAPSIMIRVPEATKDAPTPRLNSNPRSLQSPQNGDVEEVLTINWFMVFVVASAAAITVAGIIYYIRRKRREPPVSTDGGSVSSSNVKSTNKDSSSTHVSKFVAVTISLFLLCFFSNCFFLLTYLIHYAF